MRVERDLHILLTKFLNKEFLKFLIIGALNFLLTYLIYLLMLMRFNYLFSYGFSYLIGIIFSYFMNTFYVFHEKASIKKAMSFPIIYIVQFLFSEVILYFLVEHINNKILSFAPIIIIIVTVPITFLLSKYIIKGKLIK
ncbi:GtrA family protein [Paenibacillus sp. PFR10]|uniref:GtrA family protein n=1 Tax=Paenibacillus violae TaxID=3077234 RepID=A0ABU3RHW0_9BACL|nr:GtrA family protein [Paenibacillus sp. PFR10]MDU0203703.1 GtrA family protein [Paenibacillus sp. PFR10]